MEFIGWRALQAGSLKAGQVGNRGCLSEKEGKVTEPKQMRAEGCLGVGQVEMETIGELQGVQILVRGRTWDYNRSEPEDWIPVGLMTAFSKPKVRTCDTYK